MITTKAISRGEQIVSPAFFIPDPFLTPPLPVEHIRRPAQFRPPAALRARRRAVPGDAEPGRHRRAPRGRARQGAAGQVPSRRDGARRLVAGRGRRRVRPLPLPTHRSLRWCSRHVAVPCSVFVFETDRALPDALLSFVRLLLLPDQEWTTTREKSKLPKSRPLDADGARVVSAALRARLGEYASTLEVSRARSLAIVGADS
jgi:hypothetical protein